MTAIHELTLTAMIAIDLDRFVAAGTHAGAYAREFPDSNRKVALEPGNALASYRRLIPEWFDLDTRCRDAYCVAYRMAYTATKLSDCIGLGGDPDMRGHAPEACGYDHGCTGCVVDHRDSSECDEDCTPENCQFLRSIDELFGLLKEL